MNDQERTVSFEAVIFAQSVCKPDEHGVSGIAKPILITPETGYPWWFHFFLDSSEPGYYDKHFEAHDVHKKT